MAQTRQPTQTASASHPSKRSQSLPSNNRSLAAMQDTASFTFKFAFTRRDFRFTKQSVASVQRARGRAQRLSDRSSNYQEGNSTPALLAALLFPYRQRSLVVQRFVFNIAARRVAPAREGLISMASVATIVAVPQIVVLAAKRNPRFTLPPRGPLETRDCRGKCIFCKTAHIDCGQELT